MSIEKMLLVNIVGQLRSLDRTIVRCIDSECFHIENTADSVDSESTGFVPLIENNPYKDCLSKLVSIDFSGDIIFEKTDFSDVERWSLEKISDYTDEISGKMEVITKEIGETAEQISEYQQILTQLVHLHGMDVDMHSLSECKHISVRFGKLPVDSYPKLEYYGTNNFVFVHYDVDKDYYWGMYFSPVEHLEKADKVFADLYFERIMVPEFISGKPEQELKEMQKKLDEMTQRLDKLKKCRENLITKESDTINKIFCRLKYLYDSFELRSKVSVLKDKFYMIGFVAESEIEKFNEFFYDLKDVTIVTKPPDSEINIQIPVKLKTNKFTNPFSMFVEMYGLPAYGGFNPINLVAISYTILFGIMFGDLGQGLVIAILGAILYRKTKNNLCAIMSRIGISSAFFGLIFGSVFGFEHLLDPLYHSLGFEEKPIEVMDNVSTVLGAAIGIGVLLIIISILINIVTSFRKKEFDSAVFGNNGIVGLIFFGSIMYAAVNMLLFTKNVFTPLFIILLIVLPLIIMLFREPLGCMMSGKKFSMEGGAGDFIASNFFEVFEFLLGYVTNTLSFVRIGGFVLSHAAMMSVVMLLSEMFSGASPVIVVLGNIFVIVMEGMLSGIQVLRLEFYEIFSRCYDGSGKAFEPVSVVYSADID